MIAKIYIEGAKNIRNEFLRLSKELDSYNNKAAELVIYLENKAQELKDYSNNTVSKIKDKSDITKVGEDIIKKLSEVQDEEQKLVRLVKPINDEIDKLRVDEENLFKQIKDKYPNMTEQEIVKEIHSHL
jgi:chromosome segregation ATPase